MSLMPLSRPFDGFVEHTKRVSPTRLIHLERNRYSVPASFANRPVSVRVDPERIVVAAEGQILCEHRRIIERSHDLPGRTIYDWRHYLAVIQRKPGALRNGAPFAELPEGFRRLQYHLLKRPGGDREMAEILALVLQHDEQAVLCAVEMALSSDVPTYGKVGQGSQTDQRTQNAAALSAAEAPPQFLIPKNSGPFGFAGHAGEYLIRKGFGALAQSTGDTTREQLARALTGIGTRSGPQPPGLGPRTSD
jgi:hypothetical protein